MAFATNGVAAALLAVGLVLLRSACRASGEARAVRTIGTCGSSYAFPSIQNR